MKPIKAWHFTANELRDGRPIPAIGETLKHDGELVMCQSGLHASKRIIDALRYAPGAMIHRVECSGKILHGNDKLDCSERTILWTVEGDELLREFARRCALDVIDLWDAPDVVVRYLKTGDPKLRSPAWSAVARSAVKSAETAAWSAVARLPAVKSAAWSAGAGLAARSARSAWSAWSAAELAQNKRLTAMVVAANRNS